MVFSEKITSFLFNLSVNFALPAGFEVLNPFEEKDTRKACKAFYNKFYSDNTGRYAIIGINPGRFGAGITGVPFTDPIRLQNACGIINDFAKKQELSSLFIYDMIEAFGGVETFYANFYITAVSPLGFVKDGKNINYYDDRTLEKDIEPFVVDCLQKQIAWGLQTSKAFCLGEGKNFAYLQKLNEKHGFFKEIIPLSHPRFIMQYRLKKKEEYIDGYLQAFD